MDALDLDLDLLLAAVNVFEKNEGGLNAWILHEYIDTASTFDEYTIGLAATTSNSQDLDTLSQACTVLGMDNAISAD